MNRREAVLGLVALGSALRMSLAQPNAKIFRVGYLGTGSAESAGRYTSAFVQGMRELGYVEGKNVAFDFRWAAGKADQLLKLAKELVGLKPDVLVVGNPDAALAAHEASATIPIVAATITPAAAKTLVNTLSHPGGHITGLSSVTSDTSAKRLELLQIVMPKLSRVAVFWYLNDANLVNLNLLRSAAQRVGVDILLMEVRTPDEIERGFARIRKEQVRALIVLAGGLIIPHSRQIAKLAAENKIPSVFAFREFVEAGGLMSYGPDLVSMFRRCATYVDKILKGEKAGDLAIEQVSTLELVINLRTAKALGITIPKELLFRADQVIE